MNSTRLCLAVALLAAAPAVLTSPSSARPAATRAALSPVSVDVTRLRALGLGPTADLVGQAVADELANAVRPEGRLVVRVAALSINMYSGSDSAGGGGGSQGSGGGAGANDFMEGEALLVGPSGEVLRRYPIVMSQPAGSGGPSYLPDSERRRVIELSRNFARWVKRELG